MGDPTRPTRPIGSESPRRTVAEEHEVVAAPDDALLEEVRRVRFWAYFSSAVAVAASVLALIALIAALQNNDGDGSTRPALTGLRSDVAQLRSDVSQSRKAAEDAASQVESLTSRVKKLEQAAAGQGNVADDVSQLEQDLTELNDRVDQIERAQEEAASGGP
jgi:septal ring factor EnvC (AmiA/AmiB activator)